MTKTFALLLDSYRELNAKRLFWVVLAILALVVGLFAAIGVSGGTVTLFGYATFRSPYLSFFSPSAFYNYLFVTFGVEVWLSWLAAILALVSTAGMFPDLMAGGSIDLYLSKPLSRLWLFSTKLAGGLLFVALQVTVFCLCSFLVLRFRGGTWQPGVFVAVPLVVLMFSYLFAVCVLLGVLTRSTIAALLLTLMFWATIATVQWVERQAIRGQAMYEQRVASLDRQIASTEAGLAATQATTTAPATAPADDAAPRHGGAWLGSLFGGGDGRRTRSRRQLEMSLTSLRTERQQLPPDPLATPRAVLSGVLAPLPKTSGTIEVLERQLLKLTDLPPVADPSESDDAAFGPPDDPAGRRRGGGRRRMEYSDRQLDIQLRQRSAAWILGTSCAFEAVVLGLAAWVFCRRDY